MSDRVSPSQGQDSIAPSSVTKTTAHCTHSSRPTLFSEYRGPLLYNDATKEPEKEPEPTKEPEKEPEKTPEKEPEKQSNFDKVRQRAEREEEARIKAEKERDELLREKEEAERKKREAKEEFEKLYEEEKVKREELEKEHGDAKTKLQKIEEEQEEELEALLENIPEDKRPPLDESDSVAKRLKQARYAQSLLDSGPKPRVGGGGKDDEEGTDADRKKELLDARKKRQLTEDENWELMELSDE